MTGSQMCRLLRDLAALERDRGAIPPPGEGPPPQETVPDSSRAAAAGATAGGESGCDCSPAAIRPPLRKD